MVADSCVRRQPKSRLGQYAQLCRGTHAASSGVNGAVRRPVRARAGLAIKATALSRRARIAPVNRSAVGDAAKSPPQRDRRPQMCRMRRRRLRGRNRRLGDAEQHGNAVFERRGDGVAHAAPFLLGACEFVEDHQIGRMRANRPFDPGRRLGHRTAVEATADGKIPPIFGNSDFAPAAQVGEDFIALTAVVPRDVTLQRADETQAQFARAAGYRRQGKSAARGSLREIAKIAVAEDCESAMIVPSSLIDVGVSSAIRDGATPALPIRHCPDSPRLRSKSGAILVKSKPEQRLRERVMRSLYRQPRIDTNIENFLGRYSQS